MPEELVRSADRMRILHCIPSLVGGGAERQLSYLASELVQLRCEVHVAYFHGGPNLDRLRRSGAFLHALSARHNHDPILFLRLLRLVRSIRPMLIQTWMRQMDLLGGSVALLLKIPWIISERSSARSYPSILKFRARAILGRFATGVVANSASGLSYWTAKLAEGSHKQVISNGLPFEEISAAQSSASIEWLPPGKKVILFSGRFIRERNLKVVLKALLSVLLRSDAIAVLSGDGPLKPEVEAWRKEYRLEECVLLPGYLPESSLWCLMKQAAVFVSVSLHEGNPNAVLEAIACGTPLVVSDIPEHREFLDEHMAIMVKPWDYDSITSAINTILDDGTKAKARSENATAHLKGRSIRRMALEYATCYQSVLRAIELNPNPSS